MPAVFNDGVTIDMNTITSGNENIYPYANDFPFGLLPSGALEFGDVASSVSGFDNASNGGNMDVSNRFGSERVSPSQ